GGGTISNCYASGTVTVKTSGYLGGLVGYATGEIIDCYSTANVTGSYVGGLVGGSGDITIKNCKVYGRVEGTSSPGGVLGTAVDG
ncbi:MAG: GLUG motif-containing protein, partial [Oscillibacter sp.]